MKWILPVIVVVVVLFDAYVRLAPSNPSVWNVDPLNAPPSGLNSFTMKPGGADPAPVYAMTPEALMTKLNEVILSTPRTHLLAGSVQDEFATYVVRSLLWGFPDYVSVKVLPAAGGATFAIWSRSRFGKGDMGVNAARVKGWLAKLKPDEVHPTS